MLSRVEEALAASSFAFLKLAGPECPRDKIGRIVRPRQWQAAMDGARGYTEPEVAELTK